MKPCRTLSIDRHLPTLLGCGLFVLSMGCGDIVGRAILPPEEIPDTTNTEADPDASDSVSDTDAQIGDSGPVTNEGDSDTETSGGDSDTDFTDRLVPITFDNSGWIAGRDNALNIRGPWHFYGGEESRITGAYSDSTVRAAGLATPPPPGVDETYSYYFGAKIGFYICATGMISDENFTAYTAGACPYNTDLVDRVVGIVVTVEGAMPNTELRLQLNEDDRVDGTYQVLAEEGTHVFLFENADVAYNPDADPFDPDAWIEILFFIASAGGPTYFDFTIRDIAFIVADV